MLAIIPYASQGGYLFSMLYMVDPFYYAPKWTLVYHATWGESLFLMLHEVDPYVSYAPNMDSYVMSSSAACSSHFPSH